MQGLQNALASRDFVGKMACEKRVASKRAEDLKKENSELRRQLDGAKEAQQKPLEDQESKLKKERAVAVAEANQEVERPKKRVADVEKEVLNTVALSLVKIQPCIPAGLY